MDKSIGKGNATLKYIAENYFDYIVSIGDDITDEEVFEAAKPLTIGTYTTTPVESTYGYHIVYK